MESSEKNRTQTKDTGLRQPGFRGSAAGRPRRTGRRGARAAEEKAHQLRRLCEEGRRRLDHRLRSETLERYVIRRSHFRDSQAFRFLIQGAGWVRRPARMARAYSLDLRERVISAVSRDGMSCRAAARHFGIGESTAVAWLARYRRTGSAAPGRMGGYKPRAIRGGARALVARPGSAGGFHASWACRGVGGTRPEGGLPFSLDLRSRAGPEL